MGAVIRGLDARASSPPSGFGRDCVVAACVRSNPIVDVTNYVMLELARPCMLYDLACLPR